MPAGFILPPMDQVLFLILPELASGERAFGERSLRSGILPRPLHNCGLFFFFFIGSLSEFLLSLVLVISCRVP